MTILKKELKKSVKGFAVWTGAIAFMMLICIFLYPQMKDQTEGMNQLFANMGSFTAAFGMDRLNFGTLTGFYGVECGNMLGLGGGFFAAYVGITMLSKEEKEHTAEFLLTHPVRRCSVVTQKLLSVVAEITALNVIIFACSVPAIMAIGEEVPAKELLLIHGAYLALQLEIGIICLGISAFLHRGSIGIGLGLAAVLYFMNIIVNISDKAEFLKYITPFAYAEPASIIEEMSVDGLLLGLGLLYSVAFAVLGYLKYCRKDIAA